MENQEEKKDKKTGTTNEIKIEFDMKTGDAKADAPWGKTEFNLNMPATLIQTGLTQLIFYKNDGREPSEGLLKDIEGYDAIMTSKDPNHNAKKFMDIKHEAIEAGTRHENNLVIVNIIKGNGDWDG